LSSTAEIGAKQTFSRRTVHVDSETDAGEVMSSTGLKINRSYRLALGF
jgi:hypothetical protein